MRSLRIRSGAESREELLVFNVCVEEGDTRGAAMGIEGNEEAGCAAGQVKSMFFVGGCYQLF